MRAFLFLILFFHITIHAEAFRGPISSSLGGAGRAAMDGTEAVFLNPALVPLMSGFEMGAYFHDGEADPGQHRHAWGVGVGDNTSDVMFPAVLNYVRSRDTGVASGPADGEFWHLAIGKTFGNFAVGASGSRLSSNVENDQQYVQWNYSLGALWLINHDMGLAYVLNNIANAGGNVPLGIRENLQQGIGYFASLWQVARVRLDITRDEVNNPNQGMVYMAGLESITNRYVLVRLGYRYDDEYDQQYVTGGFGLAGPRLKFDYSFEKNLKGTGEALHSVDLRLPF